MVNRSEHRQRRANLILALGAVAAMAGAMTPAFPSEAQSAGLPRVRTPSAVTHLHVRSESDGEIVYVWRKPTGDFPEVTGYLMKWTGHRHRIRIDTTALKVSRAVRVPNGQQITFKVRPINRLFDRRGETGPKGVLRAGIASGKPSTPAITSISGTNVAGGGTKALTVQWSAVDPNGRGRSHYRLLDNGQRACGASGWTTGTSCTVQVPNNGKVHSFQVRATNAAGVHPTPPEGAATSHWSRFSADRNVTAAGTPAGFSDVTLTPTGNNGEATLKYTVGPSNGKSGTVDCSGSFTCHDAVGTSGKTVTDTIEGLQNGSTSSVTLTYCNGATADPNLAIDPCTTSSQVSAVTYGPIGQPTIHASANATTITVHASGDGNGAPASMTIRDDNTGATHDCGSSDGSWSCSWSESGLQYSTTYHYTVTVTDASGHGRVSQSNSASATTGPPPPPASPTVTVTKGGPVSVSGCSSAPCSYIRTTTSSGTDSSW